MSQSRQLAAIMFTDIVGYSALMGKDSAKALDLVRISKEIQKPLVEKYNGKWIKEMGDGVLAQFNTALDAVNCAIEIQKSARAELDAKLRIGIHSGDITIEDDDVYGDGVNIASRLESIADPGGIYISDAILKAIQGQSDVQTKYLGEISLKNVAYEVRTYAIQDVGLPVPDIGGPDASDLISQNQPTKKSPIWIVIGGVLVIIVLAFSLYPMIVGKSDNDVDSGTIIEDKSIAVIPFVNISKDPEQEYFSDGMMDEILNHLAKIEDLRVTSRTSVMQYKGTTKTIVEIAKELGVATILQGSVRKAGDSVRISVQLIDGSTDKHLWSETFDKNLDDVFTIQSEVAQTVANILQAEIRPEVRLRIETQPTNNTEAYDLYLKAIQLKIIDEDQNQKAIDLIDKAIKLDPNFSSAYAMMGQRLQTGATYIAIDAGMDPGRAWIISKPYLEKALSLNPENGRAHVVMGNALLYFEWDFEGAQKEFEEAKRIFPNFVPVDYLMATGKFEEALAGAKYTIETNPGSQWDMAAVIESQYFVGNHQEAVRTIEGSLVDSIFRESLAILSSAGRIYSYLGKHEKVLENVELMKAIRPELSPRDFAFEAISEYQLGNDKKASLIMEELETKSGDNAGGSPAFHLAMIYAQMEEIDIAFEWLDKAYEDHEVEMYWLKVEPPFEPLHDDPRWQVMLDKVGFPN